MCFGLGGEIGAVWDWQARQGSWFSPYMHAPYTMHPNYHLFHPIRNSTNPPLTTHHLPPPTSHPQIHTTTTSTPYPSTNIPFLTNFPCLACLSHISPNLTHPNQSTWVGTILLLGLPYFWLFVTSYALIGQLNAKEDC